MGRGAQPKRASRPECGGLRSLSLGPRRQQVETLTLCYIGRTLHSQQQGSYRRLRWS